MSGRRERAYCVCCRGTTSVVIHGPSAWKIEVICHRCNVGVCGKPTRDFGMEIDAFLRKHGCKSRRGQPILRYQGRR